MPEFFAGAIENLTQWSLGEFERCLRWLYVPILSSKNPFVNGSNQ
ncbi:hypothetical protein [Phormidium sp. CCY1219]|nr:hypothetical protein [Phormidium sp. CCY1219]